MLEWVTVTNHPPEQDEEATGEEVQLFQQYIQSNSIFPFRHQYKAFQRIRNGEECVLVAGTAAGKTLAVVIPLLLRVKNGSSKKVVFLYPTLALLEDQQETIRKVAALIGYEEQIGYIYGGMSRGELISQLTKPILVATPDAVYWFVEKNIKYSPVLFYGLCQVDDIVIDEAHILSGLMGYNLKSFMDRIQEVRLRFLSRERIRIHVLTATPTDVVSRLSEVGHIFGRSKVENVSFRSELKSGNELEYWKNLLIREASGDFQRMLLVMNSARKAHQIFYNCTNESNTETLSTFYKPFGQLPGEDIVQAMNELRVDEFLIQQWLKTSLVYVRVPIKRLPVNNKVQLSCTVLSELGSESIESIVSELLMQANKFFEKRSSHNKLLYSPKEKLFKHSQVLRQMGVLDKDSYKQTIENYGEKLQRAWDEWIQNIAQADEEVERTIADWKSLFHNMHESHLLKNIAFELEHSLMNLTVPIFKVDMPFQQEWDFSLPTIPVRVLMEECEKLEIPFIPLFQKLSAKSKIRIRHIRLLKGSNIPVILYTGSMTKKARRGLIQAFQSKEVSQAILISTSAVEAGVDFDADLLITESCTGSSFLQRFGRVGRRDGKQNRVLLVTGNGALQGKLNEIFEKRSSCNREEFSRYMNQILPVRAHLDSSPYLEILQAHVTRRMGEIGRQIATKQSNLERAVLEKGGFRYGLRNTLPQIELLDEGIGRDPFQALAQISSDQLHVVNSPFSVAKADCFFDELIYMPWRFNVFINQDETFFKMRLLLYWNKGQLHAVEASLFQQLVGSEKSYNQSWHIRFNNQELVKKFLEPGRSYPEIIKQILPYLQAVQENPRLNRYILGVGDIILFRETDGTDINKIMDAEGKEIIVPNQMFLLQPKNNEEHFDENAEYWKMLEQELLVQSWKEYSKGNKPIGHIAVDRVAGACAELYRKLVEV